MPKAPISVWPVSLGCPKNMVDTERFLGALGPDVRLAKSLGRSNIVFINTCGFIESAARESIREILAAIRHSSALKNPPFIVVAGCLVGRYGQEELARELKEVDLWLSPADLDTWAPRVAALLHSSAANERQRLHPGLPYAWLKISDGCDHRCSFCTIPAIRGRHCPEAPDRILAEARELLRKGVRELVLVGQDVSAWRAGQQTLAALLEQLASLPDLFWLRLLYLYPSGITTDLLETMARIGRPVLPYFDVPFQHSQISLLKKMGRPFSVEPRSIVEKIRSKLPHAALRTSLIVGFPGESEKDFEQLCQFVKDTRFYNLGVFCYSAEDGTPAAAMKGQISEEEKQRRRGEIMTIQARISSDILGGYVGREMEVLTDRDLAEEWPGLYAGRVWFQAPEIDGLTYVSGPGIKIGAIARCTIEQSTTYDLNALA